MAVSVVGTPASGGRSGSGSFSITPPAGATSYLAGATCPAAYLTPPSGWTLVSEVDLGTSGSKLSIYSGSSAAGSAWSTTAGTIAGAGVPVIVQMIGFSTNIGTTPAIRVINTLNPTDGAPWNRGLHCRPGILVNMMAAQSATDGAMTYPTTAPDNRGQYRLRDTSAGYTNMVGVATRTIATDAWSGEARWVIPGSTWFGTGVTLLVEDPAVTPATYALPTGNQWAGATATHSTSATSTITGTTILPDDIRLTYCGGKGVYPVASGWYRPEVLADVNATTMFAPYAVRIRTDAASIELNFRQRNADLPASAMRAMTMRVLVDGQWTTTTPIYVGPSNTGFPPTVTTATTYSAGAAGWFKVAFGSTAMRTVEIWCMAEIAGVKVPTGASVVQAPLPSWTAVAIGDSLNGNDQYGTGDTSFGLAGTYPSMASPFAYAAQSLGFDNAVNASTGASGYTLDGEGARWDNARLQVRDIQAWDPRLVIIGTGLNDTTLVTTPDYTAIGNTAQALYASVKAALPGATIIAFGSPVSTLAETQPGVVEATNAVYQPRAVAAGVWFFDPAAGVLYDPTGTAVYSPGTGWYSQSWEGPDDIHPSQAGSEAMGLAFADVFAHALPSAAAVVNVTLPDPVGVTDSATRALSAVRTQPDPVGIVDAPVATASRPRAASDAVGITDAVVAALASSASVADSVGVTDAATAALSLARTQADTVGLTDAATAALQRAVTDDDPVGIDDDVLVAVSATRAQGDAVGITDSLTVTSGSGVALGDTVGLTDTAAREVAAGRSDDDPTGITDVVTTALSAVRAQPDVVGITDSLLVDLFGAGSATIGDQVGITDGVSIIRTSGHPVADPVGITDAVTATMQRVRTIADFLDLTDAVSSVAGAGVAEADPVGVQDAVVVELYATRAPADPVGITDALVLQRSVGLALLDPIGITDSVTAVWDGYTPEPLPDELTITLLPLEMNTITITDENGRPIVGCVAEIIEKHGDTRERTLILNRSLAGLAPSDIKVMIAVRTTLVETITPVIEDAAGGVISFQFSGTLPIGYYVLEVQVTTPSEVSTHPTDGFVRVVIEPDLGP